MKKAHLASLCLAFLPTFAWAGRPFFTDDAGLTESRTCQLEAWTQRARNTHEWWALPACNPFGNFEVTAGLTELSPDGADRVRSYVLQGKTLMRPLEADNWGVGLAFGTVHPDHGRADSYYAYVPLSVSMGGDSFIVHVNLGWRSDRAQDTNRTTWGVGTEYALASRVTIFAEIFGDDVTKPTAHTGFSFGLIPDRINLDMTYGRNTESENDRNFYSVGFSLYLPP